MAVRFFKNITEVLSCKDGYLGQRRRHKNAPRNGLIRAKEQPALWERLADVWAALLPGAAVLRRTLDTTQLWSPSETTFFDSVKTEKDGESYCVAHAMPPELRDHKKIWDWLWRDTPPELRAELEASIDETMGRTK